MIPQITYENKPCKIKLKGENEFVEARTSWSKPMIHSQREIYTLYSKEEMKDLFNKYPENLLKYNLKKEDLDDYLSDIENRILITFSPTEIIPAFQGYYISNKNYAQLINENLVEEVNYYD